MKFPIDAVFLDKEMKVVSLHKNIKPWRFAFSWSANSVVELAAGKIDESQIQIAEEVGNLEEIGRMTLPARPCPNGAPALKAGVPVEPGSAFSCKEQR